MADWEQKVGNALSCVSYQGVGVGTDPVGRAHLAGAEVSAGFRKRSHNKRISFLITTVCDLVWFRIKCDFCSINKCLSSPSVIASSLPKCFQPVGPIVILLLAFSVDILECKIAHKPFHS